MRNESVDLTEIIRRMEEDIYDHEEYEKAMAWTEKHCKVNEGDDFKNRQFFAGYTFHSFGAPVSTYIREYLSTVGQ